jgi:hypothetical protein
MSLKIFCQSYPLGVVSRQLHFERMEFFSRKETSGPGFVVMADRGGARRENKSAKSQGCGRKAGFFYGDVHMIKDLGKIAAMRRILRGDLHGRQDELLSDLGAGHGVPHLGSLKTQGQRRLGEGEAKRRAVHPRGEDGKAKGLPPEHPGA